MAAGEQSPVVLEAGVPLRDSVLWRLQSAFYDTVSVDAWAKAIVPNFVSSNSFLAKAYARMVLGFARDWFLGYATSQRFVRVSQPSSPLRRHGAADPSQPIHIIEVGAGHGKLTHLLLHHLLDMRDAWPAGVQAPFKLVMTDFTQSNVDFWMQHKPLQPYVESGLLDMAVFDAVHDRSLRLLHSKQTLNASSLANPVVVINNYIFDTLPHDAFLVSQGECLQALATVSTSSATASARKQLAAAKQAGAGHAPASKVPVEAGMIKTLKCAWDYKPVEIDSLGGGYATDPSLARTLQWYKDNCEEASVLLPVGGLSLLNNVLAFSGGKAMVLVGDKAYSQVSELAGRRDPHIAVHGSFSLMVNLHAVQKYTELRQGVSMLTPYVDGFKCAAFLFGMESDVAMETQIAWEDVMASFGPENFSAVQRCVRDETHDPSLATALSVIRAAQWDSDVFYKFKGTVLAKSTAAPDKVKADLYRDVQRILATYYPLQPSKDISFELARVLMGLGRYEESVQLFQRSTDECGEHHVTWYNVGLCEFHRGNFERAIELFELSLKQSSGKYDNARSWLAKAQEQLQSRRTAE